MSLRLTDRIAQAAQVLDPVADLAQAGARGAVSAAPKPLRDFIDGTWLGVPLHPPLTDVPIGTWTAAAALDTVSVVTGSEEAAAAADVSLLVGSLAAVPTALTGLNDWSYLRGSARRVGIVHALLNVSALSLNVTAFVLRRRGRRELGRALSLTGTAIAGFSAHLGGELSFGYGVRVNRTAFERRPDDFVDVLGDDELHGDELRRANLGDVPVVLARTAGGRICAIGATCSHLGGPLDEGEREADVVVCPWHGSRFDLCSGDVEGGPAVFPQPHYETRVHDGRIEVRAARS